MKKDTTDPTDKLSQLDKYDLLIHIVNESQLSEEDQIVGIKELFPKFDPDTNTNNTIIVTDYMLEQYAYARSLGLSVGDSAHAAELSLILMRDLLQGVKLDLDTFARVARAELFGQAEMKRKHLSKLDAASSDGNAKATVAFLEKIYPNEYGQKASFDLSASDGFKKMWEIEVTHVHAEMPKENKG